MSVNRKEDRSGCAAFAPCFLFSILSAIAIQFLYVLVSNRDGGMSLVGIMLGYFTISLIHHWTGARKYFGPPTRPLASDRLGAEPAAVHAPGILVTDQNKPVTPQVESWSSPIIVSSKMLDKLSPHALLWSVTNGSVLARRSKGEWQQLVATVVLAALASALTERFLLAWYWWAVPVSIIAFGTYLVVRLSQRNQQQADSETTNSEADERAAKEALSFAYFDEIDKSNGNESVTAKAVKKRATTLGIELERGFKVG